MSSYGLWLSAAGMKVNEHRQTLLANNLANVQTAGFKKDLAVVMQRRVESQSSPTGAAFVHPVLDDLAGGVHVRPSYQSWQNGPIEWTGKPLDVAIQGDGLFTVQDGETTRYTRNGNFAVNSAGELVLATESGRWRILDEDGDPITLAEDGGEITISDDGMMRQGAEEVARIEIVMTDNPRALRKVGENLFELTEGEMKPAAGRIEGQSLEGSNFDVVEGLAGMIEATRAYQMNATLIQLQDQLTGQTVSTLGRLA